MPILAPCRSDPLITDLFQSLPIPLCLTRLAGLAFSPAANLADHLNNNQPGPCVDDASKYTHRKKDELILGFASVATAQAKHLSPGLLLLWQPQYQFIPVSKCPAAVPHHDATLPWSGSTITGGQLVVSTALPALKDDERSFLGAKPKTQSCSTSYTAQPWVLVKSDKRREKLWLPSLDVLQLNNKIQVLEEACGLSST